MERVLDLIGMKMRTAYLHGLNKGFCLIRTEGDQMQQVSWLVLWYVYPSRVI